MPQNVGYMGVGTMQQVVSANGGPLWFMRLKTTRFRHEISKITRALESLERTRKQDDDGDGNGDSEEKQ